MLESMLLKNGSTFEPGQIEFTSPGSYSWTVPQGVTEISAVCIGGGGDGNGGGGGGAVRLIWGQDRFYPSTGVEDV